MSAYDELLKATITIAGNYNLTPFDVFGKDVDEMIMLLHYLLDLGAEAKDKEQKTAPARDDGFWDF